MQNTREPLFRPTMKSKFFVISNCNENQSAWNEVFGHKSELNISWERKPFKFSSVTYLDLLHARTIFDGTSNKVEVVCCLHLSRKLLNTEIVTCILLTSNQMIFLVQFGINKHSQIFQRLQIALALRARAIFCSLWKICSCLFIPNCTRNHLITYTNCTA